jgi:hypothetical protein
VAFVQVLDFQRNYCLILLPLWLADVSCCAVADTLTLPLVAYLEAKRANEASPPSAGGSADPGTPPPFSTGAIAFPSPPVKEADLLFPGTDLPKGLTNGESAAPSPDIQ